jgi:hypothetical protein
MSVMLNPDDGKIHNICKECYCGSMESTGKKVYRGDQPLYFHVCRNCGQEAILNKEYPRIKTEGKEGE